MAKFCATQATKLNVSDNGSGSPHAKEVLITVIKRISPCPYHRKDQQQDTGRCDEL